MNVTAMLILILWAGFQPAPQSMPIGIWIWIAFVGFTWALWRDLR